MSSIKNEIKHLLLHRNVTMSELVQLLNLEYDREDTIQNLSNKLSRGTIKYSEIKEIANVLNYKIEWKPLEEEI